MRPVVGAVLAAVLVRSAAESAAPALYVSMTEYHGGSTFFSGVMDTHPCVCDMGEHFTGKGGVGVNLHRNNSFLFQVAQGPDAMRASPAARFPSEDPELCPGLGDASARSPPPSPAPARPCGDDWSGGDAWIYEPTPQLRTFNFCKKVVQLSRWPLVRGDMLLVTTGGLRGAVFQRVSEGGFDPETRAFDGVLRIERAAGGAATGRPLHFETQDRNHSRAALDDLRGCWRQPTPAPAPVFAFVSDPLDNFLRGFAQLMASSAEKRSRGESATQAISRRAFSSPAARLDAWLELHRVGRETTGLDRRVALQSYPARGAAAGAAAARRHGPRRREARRDAGGVDDEAVHRRRSLGEDDEHDDEGSRCSHRAGQPLSLTAML